MNINLQKILFGFLFFLLIVFFSLNNEYIQKKVIGNYFFTHKSKQNLYVSFDDFNYKIFKDKIYSNLYLIKNDNNQAIDTILSLPDLNIEINLLDLLFSDTLKVDNFIINSPSLYLNKKDSLFINHLELLSGNLISIPNKFFCSGLDIQNMKIINFNGDVIDSVNIAFKDIELDKDYLNVSNINVSLDSSFIHGEYLFQNQNTILNIDTFQIYPTNPVFQLFANNMTFIQNTEGRGQLIANKDSIHLFANIKYGKSNFDLDLVENIEHISAQFTNSHLYINDFISNIEIEIDSILLDGDIFISKSDSIHGVRGGSFKTNYGFVDFSFNNYKSINEVVFHFTDYDIGEFLNLESFGLLNGEVKWNFNDHLLIQVGNLNAAIKTVFFNDYTYENILFSAELDSTNLVGRLQINDNHLKSNVDLKLEKLSNKLAFQGSVNANLQYVDLNELNFEVNEALDFLSTNCTVSDITFLPFKTNKNHNFLQMRNTHIYFNDLLYSVDNEYKTIKSIDLYLNDSIGSVVFESSIGSIYTDMLRSAHNDKKMMFFRTFLNQKTNFNGPPFVFNANLHQASFFSDLLFNKIEFSDSLSVNLIYNQYKNLSFEFKTPFLKLDQFAFFNIKLSHTNNISNISNSYIEKIIISDKLSLHDLKLVTEYTRIGAFDYNLTYSSTPNSIDSSYINGDIYFQKNNNIHCGFNNESVVNFANKKWGLDTLSKIVFEKDKIQFEDCSFNYNQEKIIIDGDLTSKKGLLLSFDSFNISNINPFLLNDSMSFSGVLDGEIILNQDFFPFVKGAFYVNQFLFNNIDLGQLSFRHLSSPQNDSLYTQGIINNGNNLMSFIAKYPFHDSHNINVDVSFNLFPLDVLDVLIKPISNLEGLGTGNLELIGSIKDYTINGEVDVKNINFHIPYLNTSYSTMEHHSVIRFQNNSIIIDSLKFLDVNHNSIGFLSTFIKHQSLKDMVCEINIDSDNLFVLNTDKYYNDLYYGNIFLSGNMLVNSYLDKVVLDIDAKVEPKSKIMIPLSKSKKIKENRFVKFDNPVQVGENPLLTQSQKITMHFNVELENDSEIQLIFDEEVGDLIKGYGQGDLLLQINDVGNLDIFGDFNVEKGDYLFTLQDVITKSFDIEKGGVIRFNGVPHDALIDVNLLYNTQASLNPLNPDYDRLVKSPVVCTMKMTQELLAPHIDFSIRIPNSDQIIETSLERITNTDQKLLEQFLYLLIANSFLVENESNINYLGNTIATTGTELLSNQLSNWLSKTTDAFDLGFKWIPGTGDSLSYQQVELAISKKFLDNRFIVNGNLGTPPQQSQTNIVGDLDIEYNFFSDGRLKLRVFNRTEDYDPLSESLGYEQGLGLLFKQRFNNLRELLQSNKK